MDMTISVHEDGCRVTLAGELTINTVSEIKARLMLAMAEHDKTDIDLGRVEELDSAGLQLMMMAKRSAGKTVRFVNHSDAVLRLLDLANLGRALGDPLLIAARERA